MDKDTVEIILALVLLFSFLMITDGAKMEAAGRWLLKQIKRAYQAVF